jgi:organic hydroperoxide reductase OsmC/OhrA
LIAIKAGRASAGNTGCGFRIEVVMQPLPHHYRVSARGGRAGRVVLHHDGVAPIESAAPAEFGGPGDAWSPEGLLVAAIADCFVLSFRAVARAAQLEWDELEVSCEGTLERIEGVTAFTAFDLRAELTVGADVDPEKANAALQRAERSCLISNSLKAPVHLTPLLALRA